MKIIIFGLIIAVFSLLLIINATTQTKAEIDPERFESIKTLGGHTGILAYSENNKWLASSSDDKTIKIWNTTDWSEIKTLSYPKNRVKSLDFSENNKWLASGSTDDKIIIWDTSNWKVHKVWLIHSDDVSSVAFSDNNKWFASGSYDKTIKIWDTSDWSVIKTLDEHSHYVLSLSFSKNNRWLASSAWDNTIKVWDTSDWSEIKTITENISGISSIDFSENNEWLASGSYDRTIKIWDTSDWSEIKTLEPDSGGVNSVAFSENNQYIASGSNEIKIWDTTDWSEKIKLIGHSKDVICVKFSPNNEYLASGSDDYTIRIWNTSDWKIIKSKEGHRDTVYSVAFSENNKWLASGSRDDTIKIWNTSNWSCIQTLNEHSLFVDSVAFSKNNKWLASGSHDDTIKIWNTSNWSSIKTLSGHSDVVNYVAFSENNEWLASGSSDKTVKIWNSSGWNEIKTLTNHFDGVRCLAFSENNKWLASGSSDDRIYIWNTSGWSTKKMLDDHSENVLCVTFSKNNKWLASGSQDNTIKIWNISNWKCIKTLTGHSNLIESVAFSEDSKWLASSSYDTNIKIWNTSDWSEIRTIDRHGSSVESLAFSTNNEYLASCSFTEIKIWGNIPDLKLESNNISFSKENIISGETVTIYANIQNIGLVNSINVRINFYDGKILIGSDTINILAEETKTASIEWDVPSILGNHTIYVKIDELNNIFEENETNNFASIEINVRGADLTLTSTDISFSNENIISGETVTIYSEIQNIGLMNTTNVEINFYDNSTMIGSDIINILAGENNTASIEWEVSSILGNHTIFVKIDEENKIIEENETNSKANIEVYVRGADLTLKPSDISFSKEVIISGEIVTINTIIENIGLVNAIDVGVNFYDNTALIDSDKINILASETNNASIEWEVPSSLGNHTIYVKIDEENKIIEENETNNIANYDVNVRGADLSLKSSDIIFSKEKIITDETITINTKIQNIGLIYATDVKINFYDDSTLIDSDIINILAGETKTASVEWEVSSTLGSHIIYVKIDEENKIIEENENNNNASVEIKITSKPIATIDLISPNPVNEDETIKFYGNGTDDGTIEGYSWTSSNDGFLSSEQSFSLSNLSVGTHTILFNVKDNFGIWSEVVTEILIINDIPTAKIKSISPKPATEGEKVIFIGNYTDFENNITEFYWESNIDGFLSNKISFSLNNLSVGNHTIIFKVKDNFGVWSNPVIMKIKVIKTIEHLIKPTLEIIEIIFPDKILINQNIIIEAKIKNIGIIPISNFTVTFYHEEKRIESYEYEKILNPNEEISFNITWHAVIGNHTIKVKVETFNGELLALKESDIEIEVVKEQEDEEGSNVIYIIPIIIVVISVVGFVLVQKHKSS